jgi:hypothetical protein
MIAMIIFYILLLLLTLGYVVVNCFNLIRFRLNVPGDQSFILMTGYLLIIATIVIGSIFMAVIAAAI